MNRNFFQNLKEGNDVTGANLMFFLTLYTLYPLSSIKIFFLTLSVSQGTFFNFRKIFIHKPQEKKSFFSGRTTKRRNFFKLQKKDPQKGCPLNSRKGGVGLTGRSTKKITLFLRHPITGLRKKNWRVGYQIWVI